MGALGTSTELFEQFRSAVEADRNASSDPSAHLLRFATYQTRVILNRLARSFAAGRPAIYGLFVNQTAVSYAIAGAFAEDSPATLDDLCVELEAIVAQRWVVRLDLAHVAGPTHSVRLSKSVVFAPTRRFRSSNMADRDTGLKDHVAQRGR